MVEQVTCLGLSIPSHKQRTSCLIAKVCLSLVVYNACMQVNYHGPYTLTRLLEPVLIASKPSRIVNVASVEHRNGYIKEVRKFMFDAKKFLYSETKLANVLLTYEHQRRLGSLGVQV